MSHEEALALCGTVAGTVLRMTVAEIEAVAQTPGLTATNRAIILAVLRFRQDLAGPLPDPKESPCWPDAALEARMRHLAGYVREDAGDYGDTPQEDLACHVLALLDRVRALEAQLARKDKENP